MSDLSPAEALAVFARDASWLPSASPLIDGMFWREAGFDEASCQDWKAPRGARETPLHRPPAPTRLGHWFESVHRWLLCAQPQLRPLAFNRALGINGRTIGELDCLYADGSGATVHREVAVKYYLGARDEVSALHWIGPASTDRLEAKLDRIVHHQSRLPRLARDTGSWPNELPFPERNEVLLLGALFKHPDHQRWPALMHPRADRGFWCRARELSSWAPADAEWALLHKPYWLSPEHVGHVPRLHTLPLTAAVTASGAPWFVGNLTHCAGLGARGFVVPDSWGLDG